VRTDRHASGQELAHAVAVESIWRAQEAGENEEFGSQAPLDQAGQGNLHVGRVPIIKGDPDVGATHRSVEHQLELGGRDPRLILARIEAASGGFAHAVHCQVDDRRGQDGRGGQLLSPVSFWVIARASVR
jgi:hypothetical protein